MEQIWFWLLASMLAVYAVLDGFDFGVGILHLWLARTASERDTLLRSIGPVWDGNEVWLVAAGGTLFAAFPVLYATAFSGFYLPLMIVLWLLLFRALGIELRHQIEHELWHQFLDAAFAVSSALLALFFGAALGNLVRGLPLNEKGEFFEPLWTNFRVGEATGILDWYTLLVGLTATAALTLHGALWLGLKLGGELSERARGLVPRLWAAVVALTLLTTLASASVQPQLLRNASAFPVGLLLPLLAFGGLVVARASYATAPARAFVASGTFVSGLILSAAFAIFPYALPSRVPGRELTLLAAAASPGTTRAMLWWWLPGMAVAASYSWLIYSRMPRLFWAEHARPDDRPSAPRPQ
jgi:cytochrome bd ubiquinol oxidase subunit II